MFGIPSMLCPMWVGEDFGTPLARLFVFGGMLVFNLAWRARAAIFSAVAAGLFNVDVDPELSTSDPPERPPLIFISLVS